MTFPRTLRIALCLLVGFHVALLPVVAAAHVSSHFQTAASDTVSELGRILPAGAEIGHDCRLHVPADLYSELACEICFFLNHATGKRGQPETVNLKAPLNSGPAPIPADVPSPTELHSAPPQNKSPPIVTR